MCITEEKNSIGAQSNFIDYEDMGIDETDSVIISSRWNCMNFKMNVNCYGKVTDQTSLGISQMRLFMLMICSCFDFLELPQGKKGIDVMLNGCRVSVEGYQLCGFLELLYALFDASKKFGLGFIVKGEFCNMVGETIRVYTDQHGLMTEYNF